MVFKINLQNVEVDDREDLSNGIHSNVGSGRHDSVSSTSSLVSSGVSLVGGISVTAPANDGDSSNTFELTVPQLKEPIIFKVKIEGKEANFKAQFFVITLYFYH